MASAHGKVAMAAIDKIEALHIAQISMVVDTKLLDTRTAPQYGTQIVTMR